MSFLKKSDVKNHLSPCNHKGIHLYRPVSQPDVTGFPGEASGRPDLDPGHMVEESLKQPCSIGLETPSMEVESVSSNVAVPAASKSAHA